MVDAGLRRNRFAPISHGFLGRDGASAAAIVAEGRAQLAAYPLVQWHDGAATSAARHDDGFAVALADGGTAHGARLVLATGVVDELPAIAGLAERWGTSVFHCAYCHAYELGNGHIGVIATSPLALHHALMLPDWGRVTLFLNGAFTPDTHQRAALALRGVAIEAQHVGALADHATVVLLDGRRVETAGLFTLSRTRMASPLAQQLGCAFEDGHLGPFIRVDEAKQTTVAGVFACGDAARASASVALAVGDGALAGAAAHRSLIFG